MRRIAFRTVARTAVLLAAVLPASPAPAAPRGLPPHAWLFGAWTGGLFPVSPGLTQEACLTQPVVIFTRDVVLRASLTEPLYTQREVETARAIEGGTEFRFVGSQPPLVAGAGSDLLGLATPKPAAGFGCETPDVLHVARRTENEISFPGCADFPYPLVRCGGR
jgi:hypothetical protein